MRLSCNIANHIRNLCMYLIIIYGYDHNFNVTFTTLKYKSLVPFTSDINIIIAEYKLLHSMPNEYIRWPKNRNHSIVMLTCVNIFQ